LFSQGYFGLLRGHSRGVVRTARGRLGEFEAEGLKDGGRYLRSAYRGAHRLLDGVVRDEQHHVDVVMREATVLLLLGAAA
jgi:hypothetical protein